MKVEESGICSQGLCGRKPSFSNLAEQKGIDLKTYNEIVQECETYQSFIKQYNTRF